MTNIRIPGSSGYFRVIKSTTLREMLERYLEQHGGQQYGGDHLLRIPVDVRPLHPSIEFKHRVQALDPSIESECQTQASKPNF